jgi:hypothetical protein
MTATQLAMALGGLALTVALYIVTSTRANEHRLTALETKIGLFWKTIEEGAVGLLHHEDTPILDVLLTKAERGGLSQTEREMLIDRLKQVEMDPAKPYGERSTALMVRASLMAMQATVSRHVWFWQRSASGD